MKRLMLAYASCFLCGWMLTACGSDGLFGEGVPSDSSGSVPGTTTGQGGAPGGGQGGESASPSSGGSSGSGYDSVTNFSLPGPYSVNRSSAELSAPNCGVFNTMNYDLYVPEGGAAAPLVILGHGFTRKKDQMVDMAEHMASYGLRVVAPNYCHLSYGDVNHEQNVIDHVLLADTLANGAGVIHAGYSAGGTVAFMAAAQYANTIAVLGLDAVDSDGKAAGKAPYISAPTLGLEAEPVDCNDGNNGGVYLAKLVPDGWSIRVKGAGHCDFESPSDFFCTNFCSAQESARVELIRHLATAFVAWQAGLDPSGEDWLSPNGETYQQFVTDGDLASL